MSKLNTKFVHFQYTSPDSRVSAVNITLKTYDIVEEERNVTQIINFTMRIDAAKPGFWTESKRSFFCRITILMLNIFQTTSATFKS